MKDKNRKKNNTQDVITVLASLAIVMLAAVACGWLQRNPEISAIITGGSISPKDEESTLLFSKIVIICIVVISAIIVALFIAAMIKRRKKEAEQYRKLMEKKIQLEEARRRVEEAKKQEFINAGRSEINKRQAEYGGAFDDMDIEDDDENYSKKMGLRHFNLADELDALETEANLKRYRGSVRRLEKNKSILSRIKDFFKRFFSKG